MNFFAQQDQARRHSRRLVILFVLAVLAIVLAVDLIVVFTGLGGGDGVNPWHFDVLRMAMVSAAVLAMIGVASLFRTMGLRSGGSAVAQGMGATAVSADTDNPSWRRLRNVIEEVAIASGVPVPDIYVMEHEAGINAFAAGYTPADAAVCVTQGCLDKLTRDELQGVIAHEFSHVLNGDMRINIRLIGLLFGILVIGILGRLMMFSGGRVGGGRDRGNGGASLALIGIALLIVGYIGFFFGRMIQASVARSRETLADASAVQFTRQSDGIAGALKKIAALAEGSRLEAQDTQEVAHMLFGEGVSVSALMATHPPLLERIRALDPQFDPRELQAILEAWEQPAPAADPDDPKASLSGLIPREALLAAAAAAAMHRQVPAAESSVHIDANAVSAQVGHPGSDDYQVASSLHREMPDALLAAARSPQRVASLVLALALAAEGYARQQQLAVLDASMDAAGMDEVLALAKQTRAMHPMLRLPLASLAFPVLRRHPRPYLEAFVERLQAVIRADQHIALDEYCLAKLVQVQVLDALDPRAAEAHSGIKLGQCANQVRDLMTIVARYGNQDTDAARRAFLKAMHEVFPGRQFAFDAPQDWRTALDHALRQLDRVQPTGKELVVRGLTRAISDDGQVTVTESELLRVACASLHCPLPPVLPGTVLPGANLPGAVLPGTNTPGTPT